jgi:hypothetical protein
MGWLDIICIVVFIACIPVVINANRIAEWLMSKLVLCYNGHTWVHRGGRNASCALMGNDCGCSIPVYECARCGECDYGENNEATLTIDECGERVREELVEFKVLERHQVAGRGEVLVGEWPLWDRVHPVGRRVMIDGAVHEIRGYECIGAVDTLLPGDKVAITVKRVSA